MKQHLTLKIYRKLFFCLFISNLRWILSSLWLINNCIGFNNIFTIFYDEQIKYHYSEKYPLFNYYLSFCFLELIIIALFNMVYIYVYLPKINYIINYFKNIEQHKNLTPIIFIRASMLIFASIIFYLLLPHLLWLLSSNKITVFNFLTYLIIVIFYIIFNVTTATSIEVTFGHSIKTRLDLFTLNFLINFLTLSLFLPPTAVTSDGLIINYILLIISMTIMTFYNYNIISKKIDHYRPLSDEFKNKLNDIINAKDITIFVVCIIIAKILCLYLLLPNH